MATSRSDGDPSLRKDGGATRPSKEIFSRLLVANRGEIAIRVIRACRELGIESIAVYSDADADAPHVRMADRAERIGPPAAADSYLSTDALLAAARRAGADAVHPGYGFLSENAAFARAVEAAGLTFVGPPPATLEALGDKLAARRSVAEAGVPIVPGLLVPLVAGPGGVAEADLAEVGFPALLKAAAGGGGRGMRRVERREEIGPALEGAAREALAAFGSGTLYLEQLVAPARHVEVQLLGDLHGGLAVLGERECSVQRRHQKLVEESPSPAVTPRIRGRLTDSARRVAGTVAFDSAATVEFLLDAAGNHYFLEMNTRLQVEHGVTELVTGVDLVAWQIRVAAGERLPDAVLHAAPRGHAIEARIYAEDPHRSFAPVAGSVTTWNMPSGPGVRVDAGVTADAPLPSEYDPLLAKLMVHAADRPAAIARLRRALDETRVGGVQTTLSFLRWLVDEPSFVNGAYDTDLVADRWRGGPPLTDLERSLAAAAARGARRDAGAPQLPRTDAASSGGSRWAAEARREAVGRRRPG
ncbi:MAG TPA: biotin carboxylase N-terminal domain-containing protein [Candidatus Limnocylindria bacterium]|nr:biotin carboxylase N-terminal domain-containing protein [Candidatus Limnocylindria bacterium]